VTSPQFSSNRVRHSARAISSLPADAHCPTLARQRERAKRTMQTLAIVALGVVPRRAVIGGAAAAITTNGPSSAHAVAYRTEVYSTPNTPGRNKAKCKDIDSCLAEGERRAAEADERAGPLRNVGPIGANGFGRVRYRAMKETSDGPALGQGDAADIRFDVLSTSGNLLYGVPSREPGEAQAGVLDSYRIRLGSHDVPIGVELALEGAHKGDFRRIEVPPDLGFETSDWKPTPTGFSGRQRLENYRTRLKPGSGYAASILFQVEVMKVRPAS